MTINDVSKRGDGEARPAHARSRKALLIVVLLGIVAALVAVRMIGVAGRPVADELFRQYILDPIPPSVADIKVDQPMTRRGYGYVFRFALGEEDLVRIRSTGSFREAEEISYVEGRGLSWDWTDWNPAKPGGIRGTAFLIYPIGRQPSWYDLPTWDDPRTYAFSQQDKEDNRDIQVLLYNPELGQAYFIVFHYEAGL